MGTVYNPGIASDVTLGANPGVNIGDVVVTNVTPGTGATDLGKAVDNPAGPTDTGVVLLGIHSEANRHTNVSNGDYDAVRISSYGGMQTSPEQHHVFDTFNLTTGWTALNTDAVNIATTLKHVLGTAALTFDKVDGAANTTSAFIQKSLGAIDIGTISQHDILQTVCYLPSLTNVSAVCIRVGTDSSNYNEWSLDVTQLTAGVFLSLLFNIGDADHDGIAGNGWNPAVITYLAVGVRFDSESDTLAGIIFDEVAFHTNQHTSAELNAEVSSSVSSANVNLQKIKGSPTDKNAGNAGNGCQRVVVATDDINLAAIKTAVENQPDTSAVTSVSGSASSVELLSATATRKGATFYNDSSAILYLKFGTTASTTSYTVQLATNTYYAVPHPVYTGKIDGIWASATGDARITELT